MDTKVDWTKPVEVEWSGEWRRVKDHGPLEGRNGAHLITWMDDGVEVYGISCIGNTRNVPEQPREGEVWVNIYNDRHPGMYPGIYLSRQRADEGAHEARFSRLARIRVPFQWTPGQFDE